METMDEIIKEYSDVIGVSHKAVPTSWGGVFGRTITFSRLAGNYLSGCMFLPDGKYNHTDIIFVYDDDSEVNSNSDVEDYVINYVKERRLFDLPTR